MPQPSHTYAIDDRVVVDPTVARRKDVGVIYVVKEILPVNVVLEPERGGRRMRINPAYLLPAPATGAAPATTAEVVPFESLLQWGTVVRVDRAPAGRWKEPVEQLLVVVGDKDGGMSYRLAFLGGDPQERGRYFRNITRGWLTVVPVESINR